MGFSLSVSFLAISISLVVMDQIFSHTSLTISCERVKLHSCHAKNAGGWLECGYSATPVHQRFVSGTHMGFADRSFALQDLEYLEPARALMQSCKIK